MGRVAQGLSITLNAKGYSLLESRVREGKKGDSVWWLSGPADLLGVLPTTIWLDRRIS